MTLGEIAAEEFVSLRTVDASMQIIRSKLGAANNVQAALIAHALGYLSDPNDEGVVLAQSLFQDLTSDIP